MAKRRAKTRRPPRIDVHSHVVPAEMIAAIERDPRRFGMRLEEKDGERRITRPGGNSFPVYREFHDPEAKVAGMDRKGLDISIISAAPTVFCYWLDADAGLEAARIVNDGIARMVAAKPDRLRGMATLPMQNPDAAVAELERAVREHGFRAVELGAAVEGEPLAHPKFRPVLRRAEELKVFVFAHPYASDPLPGMEDYYLKNLIGNPLQTTIMAANLMFSGALDELKKLKICLAHGGGYVPYQIGRLAHGHRVRSETRAATRKSPYALMRRFYYDSLTHDARALRYLVELVGADRVVIGTDAPFDMADERPLEKIAKARGLTAKEREQIGYRTAMELLGGKL
jgi:aminocarboxymuconate-semialdehyde decarboxylase